MRNSFHKRTEMCQRMRVTCGHLDSRSSVMKNDKDKEDVGAVEDHDGILTIRGGGDRLDWNGIHYKQGMSAENVRTTKPLANIATIPPGGEAYAHIHLRLEV